MRNGILFLLFGLGLSSCQPGFKANTELSTRIFKNAQEARQDFEASQVVCEGECPEFAAGLFALFDDQESGPESQLVACSATLFSENQVITNAHCLPHKIRSTGALCGNVVKLSFPTHPSHSYQEVFCDRVELISPKSQSPLSPDYAILKLKEKVKRDAVVTSPREMESGEAVHFFKADYNLFEKGPQKGRIRKAQCLLNTNHKFSVRSAGAISSLFTVSDCDQKMIRGNSGVALLDKRNEMIGVFSFSRNYNGDYREIPLETLRVGGGTSLICLPFQGNDLAQNPSCEFEGVTYRDLAKLFAVERQFQAHDQFLSIRDDLEEPSAMYDPRFQWQSTDDFSELERSMDFAEPMVLKKQELLKVYLANRFLKFPRCLRTPAASGFKFSVYGLLVEKEPLEDDQGYLTRSGRLQSYQATLDPQDGTLYSVRLTGLMWNSLEGSPLVDELLGTLEYSIPLCKP
ncbi:MAG: trypsin-like serine protease [Pseudomonadota bacterium]